MKRPDHSIASCLDSSCELLVSPIPRPRIQELAVSRRPRVRRVRFVDSRKPNSLRVLREASELLRARGIEVDPEIYMKEDPSRPMAPEVLDWIARDEGMILCGVAD